MSEKELINMADDEDLGKIEISPEVIEVISGIAASEVEGVANMRGNFASDVAQRLGRKQQHGRGVKVEIEGDSITVDMYVVINYGAAILDVSKKIQENVFSTLKNMTAIELDEINVHVVGVQLEEPTKHEKD